MVHKKNLVLKYNYFIYSSNTKISEGINHCQLTMKSILNKVYNKIPFKLYTFYVYIYIYIYFSGMDLVYTMHNL
jgi:hypothetical protein